MSNFILVCLRSTSSFCAYGTDGSPYVSGLGPTVAAKMGTDTPLISLRTCLYKQKPRFSLKDRDCIEERRD